MKFTISVKPGLVGKQDLSMQLGTWPVREMTPRSLAQWSFFDHTGYCHGVFDNERFLNDPLHYKTSRANHFFQFAEIVTIDIDSKDFLDHPYTEHREELTAAAQLDKLLEIDFVKKHCFLIVPSSGNVLPDKPNWHLSFKLSERITSPEEYRRVALAIAAQIPLPTDQQTCKAAQLTAGTLFKAPLRHEAGYNWSDIYVNDDAEEVDPSIVPPVNIGSVAVFDNLTTVARARNYEQTESGSARADRHYTRPHDEREKVTLEMLAVVLPLFNVRRRYELWTQVWMSAWDGSAHKDGTPSETVRDYILNHPDVLWSDGDDGRRKFYATWNNHNPRNEGVRYTVASLFYLAIRSGWLDTTGYEIPSFWIKEIEVDHVTDWLDALDEVPKRLILQSQTGSGKTEALINLWHRLDKPKTVVFVPTIKLAGDLAAKLQRRGLPAVLYLDGRGRRKSRGELISADVLVTTLQTFAIRAQGDARIMQNYGLVYIEESDQLIAQFAKGGGSGVYQGSHVSEEQARAGFLTIKDALENSGVVWCVDATMTQVTLKLAEALSPNVPMVVNNVNTRRKQPVKMLAGMGEAYTMIYSSLKEGKRVVVACDQKSRAKEVLETMLALNVVESKSAILLTKDTEGQPEVARFMADVEEGAASYQFVVYNSVMASGVSIQNTTPDVLVQFCEYLSPRANLQILNRYRSQKHVYCYYVATENFYTRKADEIYAQAGLRVEVEGRIVNVPVVERNDIAKLRSQVAAIAAADEEMQRRSPYEMYRRLLHNDGRRVYEVDEEPMSDELNHTLKGVRAAEREKAEMIMSRWIDVEPIDRANPPSPDFDDVQVACGRLHGAIIEQFGQIPLNTDGQFTEQMTAYLEAEEITVDPQYAWPRYVAELYVKFHTKDFMLMALAKQGRIAELAEKHIKDPDKAVGAFMNNATQLDALRTARVLLPKLDEHLDDAALEKRSEAFLDALAAHRDRYDMTFDRGRYKYEAMLDKYDTPAERTLAFARVLLARAGLKLKLARVGKKDGVHVRDIYIDNLNEADTYLKWRYGDTISLREAWDGVEFEARRDRNAEALVAFERLPESERRAVLALLAEGTTSFADLMKLNHVGEGL